MPSQRSLARPRAIALATLTALLSAGATPAPAAKVATKAPTSRRAALSRALRCLLPVVTLGAEAGEYDLRGNAVLIDDEGHAVTPARVFDGLSADLLLPVAKVGVLVPGASEGLTDDLRTTRTFHRVHVLALDTDAGLALLRIQGGVGEAKPAEPAGELGWTDAATIVGFGAPGITRFAFAAHLAAILETPEAPPTTRRYALDARVTAAADGGLLVDVGSGKVHGLTSLHLRSVHRVVHKLADVEFGPPGTAVGIPLEAARSWATSVLPPPAGAEEGEAKE